MYIRSGILTAAIVAIVAAIIIIITSSSNQFEASIYNSPPIVWLLVSFSTFLAIAFFSYQLSKGRVNLASLAIVFLNKATIMALPILRGYHLQGREDAGIHIGLALDLLSGRFTFENIYPATHIALASTNRITGISLETLTLASPLVFFLIFLIGILMLTRALDMNRNESGLSLAMATVAVYFTHQGLPVNASIATFPWFLAALANLVKSPRMGNQIAVAAAGGIQVFLHPIGILLCFACMIILWVIRPRLGLIMPGIAILGISALWHSHTWIGLSVLNRITTLSEPGNLILIVTAAYGIVLIWLICLTLKRWANNTLPQNLFYIFLAATFLFLNCLALILRGYAGYEINGPVNTTMTRLNYYLPALSVPFAAKLVMWLFNRFQFRRILAASLILPLFMELCLTSWQMWPSTENGNVNCMVSESEINAVGWLCQQPFSESAHIGYITNSPRALVASILGYEKANSLYFIQLGNMTDFNSDETLPNPLYIYVSDYDRQFKTVLLADKPGVRLIYQTEDAEIWLRSEQKQ